MTQVLGFREAMTNPDYVKSGSKFGIAPKILAGTAVLLFASACAYGTKLGFGPHSPFLFGIGNLPEDFVQSLPFGTSLSSSHIRAASFPFRHPTRESDLVASAWRPDAMRSLDPSLNSISACVLHRLFFSYGRPPLPPTFQSCIPSRPTPFPSRRGPYTSRPCSNSFSPWT